MNLFNKYHNEIKPKLKEKAEIKNPMSVTKLIKIVVNVGLGEALSNQQVLKRVSEQLAEITGQKPMVTRAKTSISSFKLRAGDAVGLKVTLRRKRMSDFLQKLVSVVLPRVRDFRGVSFKGFDSRGNYSLGLTEQIVFPEIDYGKIDKIRGLEITIVTNAKNNASAVKLLQAQGVPFQKS